MTYKIEREKREIKINHLKVCKLLIFLFRINLKKGLLKYARLFINKNVYLLYFLKLHV